MSVKFYVIFNILLSVTVTYTNGRMRDCESKPGSLESEFKCYIFSNFDMRSPPPHALLPIYGFAHIDVVYVDLNIEDGVLSSIGNIFMWEDQRTRWNNENFIVLKDIKADSVWKPSFTSNDNLFLDERYYNNSFGAGRLNIMSDGDLRWMSSVDLLTRCKISSNSWPWDPQMCILNFTIDTPNTSIHLTLSESPQYLRNVPSLWSITGANKQEMAFPHLIFELTLKLESRSLQVVSCLTLIGVSLVVLPSFLISPVSRIKLASKISSLLMLVISLVMLMNSIPNFTVIAPNFLIAFGTIFSMVGASSCITAFLLRLARKSHSHHPSLIKAVGNLKENNRENEAMKTAPFEDITPFEDERAIEESLTKKSENRWLRVAVVIEYLLFAICAILLIFLIISFMT
ncbi:neuronal acetylcholine receptor subunit beta-3-like isoform X3 [Planococcus citri]|uniref:neuronal acetylcholine receptor subunit beta-3-like isoform X3 n=1 Tax=Planococcus citri TaxID=170843 RepID=UPI0031F79CA3